MEAVLIDGSRGEGGGQILRTSLALACVTGKRLHIENIRAARRNPGLAKQHLSCARAAREISGGRCKGDALGSKVLDFEPGPVRSGDYHFDIGSAGSASLVIQTVLPALFLADKPSRVTVAGGTHNPMAPPYDFLSETFLPAVSTAGFSARGGLLKHGFYPAGGGRLTFDVHQWEKTSSAPIDICEPDKQIQIHARIYTARLPGHIAQRQERLLRKGGLDIEEVEHIEVAHSDGPGNCVMIRICGDSRVTVFTAFGERGKPSEKVVGEVVNFARDFLAGGAAVDHFLADQLLIYMAVSQAGTYTTNELSKHLATNMEVIKEFLPVEFTADEYGKRYKVSCRPG